MPDKAWKQFERRIAPLFGGVRRGPVYRKEGGGGTNDIKGLEGKWSIECKKYRRPGFQTIVDAVKQAEAAAGPGEIPIAILGRHREKDKDATVAMRLETFLEWFGGGATVPDPTEGDPDD